MLKKIRPPHIFLFFIIAAGIIAGIYLMRKKPQPVPTKPPQATKPAVIKSVPPKRQSDADKALKELEEKYPTRP